MSKSRTAETRKNIIDIIREIESDELGILTPRHLASFRKNLASKKDYENLFSRIFPNARIPKGNMSKIYERLQNNAQNNVKRLKREDKPADKLTTEQKQVAIRMYSEDRIALNPEAIDRLEKLGIGVEELRKLANIEYGIELPENYANWDMKTVKDYLNIMHEEADDPVGMKSDMKKVSENFVKNLEQSVAEGKQEEGQILFNSPDFKNIVNIDTMPKLTKKQFVENRVEKLKSGEIEPTEELFDRLAKGGITNEQLGQLIRALNFGTVKKSATKNELINHIMKKIDEKPNDPKYEEKVVEENEDNLLNTILEDLKNGKPLTHEIKELLNEEGITKEKLTELMKSQGFPPTTKGMSRATMLSMLGDAIDKKAVGDATKTEEEKDRLAQVESDRLAQVESDRVAQVESDRVAQVESDRVAQVESDRVARVAKEETARLKRAAELRKKQEDELKRQEERKNMTPEEVKAEADDIASAAAEDVSAGQNLFKRVAVRPPAADSAMRSSETDTTEFDSIGYSINNADSAAEISKIIPTVKQQADSNKRIALNNVVTSSLWRAFDSTMNQDLILRHRIINGGILDNGTVANRRKKKGPVPRRKATQLRNVLYNRNFYIPRDPPLSTKLTGLNSRELHTWDNRKYNPQGAPWRSPPVI
jgi:hypothetical protein